jgi:hypothetical protein
LSPTPQAKQGARRDVIDVSSTLGSEGVVLPSSPPTIMDTPISHRPKNKKVVTEPPPFDPNTEGDRPRYVTISFISVVGGKARPTATATTLNINDTFRPFFGDLWEVSYKGQVRKWEEQRQLTASERARRGAWTVTVGNPKGNSAVKYEVSNDDEWTAIHSRLRSMAYYGDKKNLEWAHSLTVECEWVTIDQPTSPSENPKAKKGGPRGVQSVALERSSDIDVDEQDSDSEDPSATKRTSSK